MTSKEIFKRDDVRFKTFDGLTLGGWLYTPINVKEALPTIIISLGFGAIKEHYFVNFAERFAAEGFAVLIYDNRNFGDSEGEPRHEVDPVLQVRDLRDAITYALSLDVVDNEKIGIWGSSYSGGHVLQVGAFDKRVKCIVAQVPEINGYFDIKFNVRADLVPELLRGFEYDREQRSKGEDPIYLPIYSEDESVECALPGKEAYEFLKDCDNGYNWENKVTLKSLEMLQEYWPAATIERISPIPLLMIVGLEDNITAADLALKAYQEALEPKKLFTLPCGHFEPYTKHFDKSSQAAIDWFNEHLN